MSNYITFASATDERDEDGYCEECTSAADLRGRQVAGNLPLHLAAVCRQVDAVEFFGQPPRGAEYTMDDMVRAGAHIRSYVVREAGPLRAVLEEGGYCGLPPVLEPPFSVAFARTRYACGADEGPDWAMAADLR